MAAKTISTFNREHEVLSFKGGFMEGLSLDEDSFKSIARLPARRASTPSSPASSPAR